MSMTRAEYEAVASAIHEADVPQEAAVTMALEIATALCATNDRFDPVRFLHQTGLAISDEQTRNYSHGLRLRTTTGVGATREAIARERGQ